ncbi:MAG TPA: lipopolysaccharide biosynthesis protein [Polyangia bacterium]|nr:lipopolysaccharide biosynthesis protein [Polyangia bacterium]
MPADTEVSEIGATAAAGEAGARAGGLDLSRAARSTLWSALENGGLALISFSSLIIYARFLSPAEFGLFSIVLALVELLDVLVSMLFHDALVQRRQVTPLHFDTAFTVTLALGVALFAACWGLAPLFAALVHNGEAAAVLVWTALRLPCTALSATIVAEQRRDLAFRVLAFRSLLGRTSGAVLGIALVALGAGVWGLVVQQILIALIGSLVLWTGADRRPRLRFSVAALCELISFGAYAMGGLFLNFAVKRIFTIVAGVRLGAQAAGYLNIAFRAVDVLWAIAATAVGQVALPVLARMQADPARVKSAYRSAVELTCFVLFPCFWGIALCAPEVVELLFGARWLTSSATVVALALLTTVQAPRLLITPTLNAVGRPREPLIGLAIELAISIGCLLALGRPVLSLSMAVAIWIARELSAAPVMALVLARATGIGLRDQLARVGAPLAAAGAMALALLGLRQLLPAEWAPAARLAALAPSGAAVYLAAAWSVDAAPLRRLAAFLASVARPPRGARAPLDASAGAQGE